jgi:hypothetical protein
MLGYDTGGRTLNTRQNVFRHMIVALVFHYQCLPDFRTLTYHQIEFFYDAIRGHLKGGK